MLNNYPKKIVSKHINKKISKLNKRITNSRKYIVIGNKVNEKIITIPYYGNTGFFN